MSYKLFTDEIASQKGLAKFLPSSFFIIAALFTFLTMPHLVDTQRTQVGIMKAMGASKQQIALHYMSYALFVGLLGNVIGAVTGSIVFPKIFTEQFATLFSTPGFTTTFQLEYVMIPFVVFTFIGMLACYLPVRKILKESTAQALRPKTPQNVNSTSMRGLSGLIEKTNYPNRLMIQNILRNKKRIFFSSAGVLCCIIILIFFVWIQRCRINGD